MTGMVGRLMGGFAGGGGRGEPGPTIEISALTAPADNAAQGTVIATLTPPENYTLVMNDDSNGLFQLDGNDLEVGPQAASLRATWYLVVIGAYRTDPDSGLPDIPTASSWTEISKYVLVQVTSALSPGDITGLTHGYDLSDAANLTLSGVNNDITAVAAAWGTSNAGTGTFAASGGSIRPRFQVGAGPNGKGYALFNSGGRSRITFATTGALTAATFFVVFQSATPSSQMAGFGNTNNNNYVALNGSANAWTSQVGVKGNGGTEHTSNLGANGLLDNQGLQVLVVVWDGANYIPYVNNVAGASSAHTDAITITQFGGLNTSLNFGGGVTAFGIYNKALDATERALLFRALDKYRTRDFFFSTTGSDSANGWTPTTPRLSPVTFSAAYKTAPGTRFMLAEGETFSVTSAITFPLDTADRGIRGGVYAFSASTRQPSGTKVILEGNGSAPVINSTSGYLQVMDIKATDTAGTGSIRLRGSAHSINRSEMDLANADAANLAGTGIVHTDCYIHNVGPGTPATPSDFTSTNYDGHTMHGGSGKFYRMVLRNCEWHAFAHQDQSNPLEYYGLIIDDSGFAARIIANGGVGTLLKIRRAYISAQIYGLRWDAGADMDLDIDDALLVKLGTQGVEVALDKNGASVTFTVGANVSQTGFASLE
jgi:hypothetical protein